MHKDSGIETLALDAPATEGDALVARASRRAITRRGAVGLLGGAGALAVGGLPIAPAAGEVRIDITRGNIEPLPIAVTEFFGVSEDEAGIGRDIASVITADLERSGLFAPIDRRAFIQTAASMKVRPRFSDWRVINAQALVNGSVELKPDGRVRVEFRLWDVFAEAQMLGRAYQTEQPHWRRVAHIIADAIYQRITGEQGYFDTRIVYVAESGPKIDRTRRLAIMDQDGANHRFLTDGRAMALTPRFSPARQEITYLSYFNNTPRVYLFNIRTGRQEVLGAFDGMTFAPRFSPDGNSVIMSHAEAGNSDIYLMDLRTRTPRRLTDHPGIDTAPSFAPDGERITFESDRGGSQQIYVMNVDGSDLHRISFGEGRYATPVWSPRGDLIAFTKLHRGEFFIGVMRPDGTGERLLVGGYHNEGPTWAPNGRVLMFFRETRGEQGSSTLFSIDLTGYNLREVVTPGDASDPAWSPLNP
ncbi:MAG: Tol-Pal system beta propeller repeat protein TolB [Marivibrio sp.]|uniref:Tol-Pal system beta propeller repeat protein TolB n=1 Tax=Marivibrio sp. TaxID=2039719 RepID=UPI0032EE975D